MTSIGREGFAVPEHFPTIKIFFRRLEGPFRRVASLAEIFHPLLWIDSLRHCTWRALVHVGALQAATRDVVQVLPPLF